MQARFVTVFAWISLWLLLSAGVSAQTPAPVKSDDSKTKSPQVYRFRETHGVVEGQTLAKAAPQFEVTLVERLKAREDQTQGAPKISEQTQRAVFVERPAQVSFQGDITALVRKYNSVKIGENANKAKSDPRMLEGLTAWVEPRLSEAPRVISLSNRQVRDVEYQRISVHPFLPALSILLPVLPVKIGESWRISPNGAFALAQCRPGNDEKDGLRGKLLEVKDGPNAGEKTAIISIAGKGQGLWDGDLAVNARVEFRFPAPIGSAANAEVINAPGTIAKLSVGQMETVLLEGKRNTLKRYLSREWIVTRQSIAPGEALLTIPAASPQPTMANSWLSMDLQDSESQNTIKLRYPQDYRPSPDPESNGLFLIRRQPNGPDIIMLSPDFQNHVNLEAKRKGRFDSWQKAGEKAKPGQTYTLAKADWPNREARRFEATLDRDDKDSNSTYQISFNGYVINFARKMGLYAEALTVSKGKEADAFRQEAEQVLQSFQPETKSKTAR